MNYNSIIIENIRKVNAMFYSSREDEILDLLEKRNGVSVHFLSKELAVSEPTVRRALSSLEKRGKIKRTFGGAVLAELENRETPLSFRESEDMTAKKEIAAKAAELIRDDMVIFMDGSTTAACLADELSKFKNLTVITNNPRLTLRLAEENIRTFCTGGFMLNHSASYGGEFALDFIKNFNADMMFFSCRGISYKGEITDSSVENTEVRKIMMQRSKSHIFLCADSKVGKTFMIKVCDLSLVDKIICNAPIPENMENMLRHKE